MSVHNFQYRYNFGRHRGGPNSFVLDLSVGRDGATDDARVFIALTGFDVRFSDSDENLRQIIVKAEREGTGSTREKIPVRVTLGLRDKGNWDNTFEGFVKLNLIVVDNEPHVRGFGISVGCASHPENRRGASIAMRRPEGYATVALGLISRFEFSYDGRTDNEVCGFAVGFSKDTFNGAEVINSGDTVTIQANCEFWDKKSRDDRWHSYVDATVLFLPADRYSVRPIFAQIPWKSHEGGRWEARRDIELGPQYSDYAFAMDRIAARFVGDDEHNIEFDDRPLYRVTADLMIDGFSRNSDKSVAHAVLRLGLRDRSGDWDDPYDGCVGGQLVGIDRRRRLPDWWPEMEPEEMFKPVVEGIAERLRDYLSKNLKKKPK